MFSGLVSCQSTPVTGVQLWTAQLELLSAAEMTTLGTFLDEAERARATRFHFEQDRRNYVASRGLLRHLLGSILGVPANTLIFEYGANGKPALSAAFSRERVLCFNLSHSAGWAMFALAWDRALGIDLESAARLDRDGDGLTGLATRVLSGRELNIWKALPDADAREAAFLRAWTRKEAYAKATGRGLFDTLTSLEVILDAAAPQPQLMLPGKQSWGLHDLPAPEGFAAALAVEHRSAD